MVLFKRNTPNKAAVGEGSKEANVKEEQKTTMKAPPSDSPSAKDKQKKKPTPKGEGSSSDKSSKNEVDPVVELRKRYDDFVKKLDTMIAAFKKRRELMIHSRKADNDIFRQMMAWTEDTPLALTLGVSVSPSYASVNSTLIEASRSSEDLFEEKVIDYAVEWKKLVSLTFMSEHGEVIAAKKAFEHYKKKVETLRSNLASARAHQKEITPLSSEKFDRNEEKLENAEKSYEKHKRHLIYLVDELIENAWKDLYPLLMRIFQFHVNDAQDRAVILSDLHDVMRNLSTSARDNGIVPHESHSTTELWRKIRFQWHESSATSLRKESPAIRSKDKHTFQAAVEDVDMDWGKDIEDLPQFDNKEKFSVVQHKKEKNPNKQGKTGGSGHKKVASDDDHVDETSFTEQMLEEDLSERSWSSSDKPLAF